MLFSSGVKAVGDVWSTDALTTFVQLCYDQDLTLSTVSLKNKTYIVKITNQDGLDVADQLIQAGMAATATQGMTRFWAISKIIKVFNICFATSKKHLLNVIYV